MICKNLGMETVFPRFVVPHDQIKTVLQPSDPERKNSALLTALGRKRFYLFNGIAESVADVAFGGSVNVAQPANESAVAGRYEICIERCGAGVCTTQRISIFCPHCKHVRTKEQNNKRKRGAVSGEGERRSLRTRSNSVIVSRICES
jgi:hypothetical protein